MRFCNAKLFHPLFETSQIVTLSLASPIQVFPQRPDGVEIEHIETVEVAIYTEVIIVSSQFCVPRFEQFW